MKTAQEILLLQKEYEAKLQALVKKNVDDFIKANAATIETNLITQLKYTYSVTLPNAFKCLFEAGMPESSAPRYMDLEWSTFCNKIIELGYETTTEHTETETVITVFVSSKNKF